ncbi:MAG: hypothetical protein QM767_20910 [Anaeromyxobacter sp.]
MVAVLLALGFVALALASGEHRLGAVIGATTAGLTGLGSLFAMTRLAGRGVNGALLVVTLGFLLRMVLVAIGAVVVAQAGLSKAGFLIGFFVPFFALVAVEAAHVHSLPRRTGTP